MNEATPVHARGIVAGTLLALALSACGHAPPGADGALAPTWDRETVLATLDLSELGEITVADDGTFLIGGKRLPEGLPRDLAHGRDLNLLRLDDEALNSVPLATRDALLFADAHAMRLHLEDVGVPIRAVRAALRDGGVQAHELRALAEGAPAGGRLRSFLVGPEGER